MLWQDTGALRTGSAAVTAVKDRYNLFSDSPGAATSVMVQQCSPLRRPGRGQTVMAQLRSNLSMHNRGQICHGPAAVKSVTAQPRSRHTRPSRRNNFFGQPCPRLYHCPFAAISDAFHPWSHLSRPSRGHKRYSPARSEIASASSRLPAADTAQPRSHQTRARAAERELRFLAHAEPLGGQRAFRVSPAVRSPHGPHGRPLRRPATRTGRGTGQSASSSQAASPAASGGGGKTRR